MIEVGMYAKYVNTGTVGKVTEVTEIDGRQFAYLDSTGLYYDLKYLEETEKPIERGGAGIGDGAARNMQEDSARTIGGGEMSDNIAG